MWSTITSIARAVGLFLGVIQKGQDAAHDSNERKAGQDAASVGVQQATIDSQQRQAQAGVNSASSTDEVVGRMKKGDF